MTGFRIGTVLRTGFACWLKNIVPFLLVTVVVYSPFIAYAIFTFQGDADLGQLMRAAERFAWVSTVAVLLLDVLVASALTYGVVKELSGEHAPILRCIGVGLSRFFPVLGVSLLVMLAIAGGLILLIVPGLIVMCMLYVACNVAVIERLGVRGALARSRDLTAGLRWQIFGIILLLGVLEYVAGEIVESFVLGEPQTVEELQSMLQSLVYATLGRMVVLGSLSAVMTSVVYYYLRQEKEGTSAGELARVFE